MWDGVSLDCAQALPWSLLVLDIQMFYSCGGQLSLLVHIWLKISNPVPKSFIHTVKLYLLIWIMLATTWR